jgi:Pyridine nucleotide-disulphide oxidoreductase
MHKIDGGACDTMEVYEWAVIGAGPAGIAALGKLLDNGVDGGKIAWIDPRFTVGDFGAKWGNVSSNTKVRRFQRYLRDCKSFDYERYERSFGLSNIDADETCFLRQVYEPLQRITDNLRTKVTSKQSRVSSVRLDEGRQWQIQLEHEHVLARKVVLAIGAEPKKLDYNTPAISLEDALDIDKLARIIKHADVVGVFGSSHSAIMAVRNLLELETPPKQVINFYRSPLRYAVDYGDWILYDNTGLKGKVAVWAKEKIDGKDIEGLLRVQSTKENIDRYLPLCSKVIYGVGFEPRGISVQGVNASNYDEDTGVIAPGLFGCGIAYPRKVVDRAGNVEYDVGLWKFMNHLDRAVPIWMNKIEETKKVEMDPRSGPSKRNAQ